MTQIDLKRPLLDADLAGLLQASDWNDLRQRMSELTTRLDISDFILKMHIGSPNGNLQCHVFGSLPATILDIFSSEKMDDTDPINRHLAKSSLPLSWQAKQLCALETGNVYAQLNALGIEHGFSLKAQGEHVASRVDFYSKTPSPFPSSVSQSAEAHLLGLHLTEAARLIWQKTAPNQARLLSPRELECLHWSASGKTSQEIGQILGISQHTVYFHLKNVATKLNVYGTRHAISRAITMGIITSKI